VFSLERDALVRNLRQRLVEVESTNQILEGLLQDERETVGVLRRF
jgi:hypothetical protein